MRSRLLEVSIRNSAVRAQLVFLVAGPSVVGCSGKVCSRLWNNDFSLYSYTEKYFSPTIIEAELASEFHKSGSMSTTVFRTAQGLELRVVYRVDDTNLEFSVKIPPVYPLRNVTVEGSQQVVAENRWRRWLLNCHTMIAAHEGTISDSLNTWKLNADKHFEGIDDCAICYCV